MKQYMPPTCNLIALSAVWPYRTAEVLTENVRSMINNVRVKGLIAVNAESKHLTFVSHPRRAAEESFAKPTASKPVARNTSFS